MARRTREPHPDTAQAPDCEFDAYLSGRYAQWLQDNDRGVPAWTWLNRVAHSSLEDLERMSRGRHIIGTNDDPASLWQHVVTFLAKEILDVAPTCSELVRLQRSTLVPLELELAKNWWRPMVPLDLATEVMVALDAAASR